MPEAARRPGRSLAGGASAETLTTVPGCDGYSPRKISTALVSKIFCHSGATMQSQSSWA
jgi:hypothetical protein